jgi:glutathione synthase/RimK-type ligase-like ATP-grasp enzyme
LGYYNAFIKKGYKVKVVTALNAIDLKNQKILILVSRWYQQILKGDNYANVIQQYIKELEEQGNEVFPSYEEILYWENKDYMHRMFKKLEIRTPATFFADEVNDFEKLKYPLLVKEIHSAGSAGLHKVENATALNELVKQKGAKNIIIQELLNIKKDLRVIIIDGEIVLHYWRINTSDKWKPTSTSHGSLVDFEFFPMRHKKWILDQYNKLGIRVAAFDIAWDNDNLDTTPYVLEVSPLYLPNPAMPKKWKDKSYAEWKKTLGLKNGYVRKLTDLIFDLNSKYVKFFN